METIEKKLEIFSFSKTLGADKYAFSMLGLRRLEKSSNFAFLDLHGSDQVVDTKCWMRKKTAVTSTIGH